MCDIYATKCCISNKNTSKYTQNTLFYILGIDRKNRIDVEKIIN